MSNMQKKEVGVYIHIPFCVKRCDYCSFVSCSNFKLQPQYLYRLKTEIKQRARGERVDTIYIGGGTPSTLQRGALLEIKDTLASAFDLGSVREFTVECNPESASDEFFDECVLIGVNRISMGLQSADDEVLARAGRVHNVSTFFDAARRARAHGISNLSGDVMIGLEGEKKGGSVNAVRMLAGEGFSHVSAYALSVDEPTPLSGRGFSPDADEQADEYERVASELKSLGYERYEISNFARDGKRAIHNTKYWTGEDYYGFGAAAHSLLGDKRFANSEDIIAYSEGEEPTVIDLTADDKRTEFLMLRLRMKEGFSLQEYESRFGSDILREKRQEIEKLVLQNLITIRNGRLAVSDSGIYLTNSVIVELL